MSSFNVVCVAQTHYENLKEADRQRALTNERNKESDRQNLDNNRPTERKATSSNTSSTNSSWEMTGRNEREQKERAVSDAKNKGLLDAYDAKIAVINNCYKTYPRIRENYDKIFNCAISNGVDNYTAGRIIGFSADELQSKIDLANPSNNEKYKTSENKPVVKNYTFTGTIVQGKKIGKGICTKPDGTVENGEYVDDLLEGYATVKKSDGKLYEGYFLKGKKSGKGKITYADGSIMEGDFLDDDLYGFGRINFVNSYKYEGEFVAGYISGKGKYTYADGSVCEGYFVRNRKQGGGSVMKYSNGDVYEGAFFQDKYHGDGKYTKKNGYSMLGLFKEGLPVKVKYYNPANEKITKKEFEKN